jgi:hypothetical protein
MVRTVMGWADGRIAESMKAMAADDARSQNAIARKAFDTVVRVCDVALAGDREAVRALRLRAMAERDRFDARLAPAVPAPRPIRSPDSCARFRNFESPKSHPWSSP